MILINVLPPEFRKRDTGVSPIFLAVVAGVLLNLVAIVGSFIIHYQMIPRAEEHRDTREAHLAMLEQRVAEIEERKRQIEQAERRRDTLFSLLGKKVFMARPLHEFVSLIGSSNYTEPGFLVSISRLEMSPQAQAATRGRRSGGRGQDPVTVIDWRWQMKIVGEKPALSGSYIKSFFQRVANSDFWSHNQFLGEPTDSYTGDAPVFNEEIDKVTIGLQLNWSRVVKPISFVTRSRSDNGRPAAGGR